MACHRTGKRPHRLKWIDSNKGDSAHPNVRSRLVCTEVRPKGVEAIFAATPPLESLRMRLAILSQEDPATTNDPYCLSLSDVSRAHFYAKAVREVYIQLPPEDPRHGDKDVCGRLLRTMYGTLDAADRWADHYSSILKQSGFHQGTASPCHFYHPGWGVYLVVHGDDFIMAARRDGRQRTLKLLEDHFEIKTSTAGACSGMDREIKVLGRVAICHPWGWSLEADPSLLENAVDRLSMCDSKGAATPGVKDESGDKATDVRSR